MNCKYLTLYFYFVKSRFRKIKVPFKIQEDLSIKYILNGKGVPRDI